MYNGAVLTSDLVKLAEETANDETQLQKNLNAIDGCASLRNVATNIELFCSLLSYSLLIYAIKYK